MKTARGGEIDPPATADPILNNERFRFCYKWIAAPPHAGPQWRIAAAWTGWSRLWHA